MIKFNRTHYGIKKKGGGIFVIVAPHAAGDDLRTAELAQEIAKQLKASFAINKKYKKPSNSKIKNNPKLLKQLGEDFNKLTWPKRKGKWEEKHKHRSEFYDDIKNFVNCIHKYNKKAVIVYIHGMRDGKDKIGIDIGCGLKYYNNKLLTAAKHPKSGPNNGVRRAKREHMEYLKEILGEKINKYNLKVGIGEAKRGRQKFVAWNKKNGIQFHARTKDSSFQLEIAYKLRQQESWRDTSEIIAESLKLVYKPFII